MDCLFCDIIAGRRDGHFIYQDDYHVAFLDKYPIDKGHALVLPKKHYEKITDMSPQSVGELFSQLPKIAKAIITATNADAFSLAQNNGRAAKQIIPHVHVHIIPRYNDMGAVWTKRTIPSPADLESLAQQIRQKLN